MKFTKIAFLFVFVLTTTLAMAQSKNKAQVAKDLGITEEQVVSFEAINKKYAEEGKTLKADNTLSKKAKSQKAKELKSKREEELIGLLGQEKFNEYQAYLANQRTEKQEERAAAISELGLTAEQEQQLKAINQKYLKEGKTVKEDTSLAPEQKKAKGKEMNDARLAEIKTVLSTEQYEKFVAMEKEKRGQK
ncbi:MAG: hypothetical protein HC892_19135 [Saprospiraceae bacterium]|nr:hypothetical protein [Saprospiraceae bacterium]